LSCWIAFQPQEECLRLALESGDVEQQITKYYQEATTYMYITYRVIFISYKVQQHELKNVLNRYSRR
jgi:hypothetical protein